MPLVTRFDTPGGLRDLPEDSEFYKIWHEKINDLLDGGRAGAGNVGEFYNPARKDVKPVAERLMNWMGFPRRLMMKHRDDRQKAFEEGELRDPQEEDKQEEYFEWQVTPAGAGKIKKVTFTTETAFYWNALFEFDRGKRVLGLYQALVSPLVKMEHLVIDNNYNPLNVWNTEKGIVHYIVGINTLEDANGVAQGGVNLIDPHARDNYELQTNLQFPFPIFSADARVGIDVNVLARKGLSVTLREPIGLYMAEWDDTGWTKPDGSPVGNYWCIVRGKPGMALRLEYEVPESEGFLVSDISIGGRPIKYGGHLAEHITVMAGGLAGLPA